MSSQTVSLDKKLESLREQVNEALERVIESRSDCPQRLRDAMAHSLLAGGKRLRPLLVLLACEVCGGDVVAAMPAACALEMVHTYSLIHDDLPAMDDDDLRRGQPTCHVQFDEATAILAGDALLTLAFELMARDVQPPAVAAECCYDLAAAAGYCGMVGGQMADLQAEQLSVEQSSVEQLEAIHRRKTGRLLISAMSLGARIGGATENQQNCLEKYGQSLGLAFQITDDLLDVTGDCAKMGKAVGKDSGHGKLTYPAMIGETESRRKADELIADAQHSLQTFGDARQHLDALAQWVLKRDH